MAPFVTEQVGHSTRSRSNNTIAFAFTLLGTSMTLNRMAPCNLPARTSLWWPRVTKSLHALNPLTHTSTAAPPPRST